MINKFLLKSLLVTSSLTIISSANAMEDDGKERIVPNVLSVKVSPVEVAEFESGNLILSVTQLKKGFEAGQLVTNHGTFSVSKAYEWSMPSFEMIWDQNIKIYGYDRGKDEYIFTCMVGGGPRYVYNEQTLQWEYDYNQIDPGYEGLGLVLKKMETQSLNEIIAETASMPLISPSANEGKQEDVLPKEESVSVLSKGKIFKESDTPKNTAQKDFYLQYDQQRNFWVGIEYLTPKAVTWWTQRLGWDAQMHFGEQIKREHAMILEMPLETQISIQQASMEFAESMSRVFGGSSSNSTDLLPQYVREAEEFCCLRSSELESSKEFMGLYDERAPKNPGHPQNDDYLSAWRGFQYNLKHAHERPTWIAYISSKPTEGPLHDTVSVTSPDIKMMMTATPGDKFYSPLGIYKSPIATAYDEKVGQKSDQLSMTLHRETARFMHQIQPKMQYMVVRPISSMKSIFEKSKVPFFSSNGRRQTTDLPHVRCTTPFQLRWYASPEDLTTEEMENFGESPYIIIDPRTNEYHQISDQHWFSESPFLGGKTRNFFETFPFVTVDIKDLEKL